MAPANLASAGGNERRLTAIWANDRPTSDPNNDGGLTAAISPTGLLSGFRYQDHCFFAFDLNADTRYNRNGIKVVSPFVLLGADTPLHEPDVERIAKRIREHDPQWRDNGIPKVGQLENGLNHPNPAVRTVAKRLLEIPRR